MRWILSLIFLVGCGAKEAKVAKQNIEASNVVSFSSSTNSRFVFPSVTMFLWRETKLENSNDTSIDPNVVATVSRDSDKISDDDLKGMALTNSPDQKELDTWNQQKLQGRRDLQAKKNQIVSEQKVADALKLQVSQNPNDADLKKKLDAEAATLLQLNNDSDALNKEIADLSAKIPARQQDIDAKREGISQDSQKWLGEIQSLVDWYDKRPDEIFVDVTAGIVHMDGWDPNDGYGQRNFTSEAAPHDASQFHAGTIYGSINKFAFDPDGGRITFFVEAGNGYTFKISVIRSNYDDPFGRTLMKGAITRYQVDPQDPTHIIKRYGIVSLADRAN